MFLCELSVQGLECAAGKFYDFAAFNAKKMIVMRFADHLLIMGVIFAKFEEPQEPAVDQELQRPVDRGARNPLSLLAQLQE